VSGESAESTIKYEYDSGSRLTKIIDSASGTYADGALRDAAQEREVIEALGT
jgi:hypothetical protein